MNALIQAARGNLTRGRYLVGTYDYTLHSSVCYVCGSEAGLWHTSSKAESAMPPSDGTCCSHRSRAFSAQPDRPTTPPPTRLWTPSPTLSTHRQAG